MVHHHLHQVNKMIFFSFKALFYFLEPVGPLGDGSSILDVYLTVEARRLGKVVTSLESVATYCEVCYYFNRVFKIII